MGGGSIRKEFTETLMVKIIGKQEELGGMYSAFRLIHEYNVWVVTTLGSRVSQNFR